MPGRRSGALAVSAGLLLAGSQQAAAEPYVYKGPDSQNQGQELWQGAAGPNYYAGDSTLSLQFLTSYPGAVCNDGSPAGYYYRQGSDPNLFIVFLEGGA